MPKGSDILPKTKPIASKREKRIQFFFYMPETKQENSKTEVLLQAITVF